MNKLNFKTILDQTNNYEIVSFDCFDTLITRCIRTGDDILKMTDTLVSLKYKCPVNYFYKLRKKARNNLVKKNYKIDYTLDQIYTEFKKISKFNKNELREIKKLEVETDLKFVIPRKDMLDLYNAILVRKQKIIIISDMYYTKDIIAKMLSKCGFKNWNEIIVSCEHNSKKLTGSLWKKYYKKYGSSSIHIGDNWLSDKFWPKHYHKPVIKLSSSFKLASKSKYSEKKSDIVLKTVEGLIYNKCLFNSPFVHSNSCDTNFKFGYAILGPLFLSYFHWIKQYIKDKQLLFFARDGYYLQKVYDLILQHSKCYPHNENAYLFASRTSIICANIVSFDDIKQIISVKMFKGHLKDFFMNRFGLKIKDEDDKVVTYANKNRYAYQVANKYKDQILSKFKKEREDYLKYLNKNIKNNAIVLDLGYIGTIQYYLNKLVNKNFDGLYFYNPPFSKPSRNKMSAKCCFGPKIQIHRWFVFIKLLEPFMTAPYGQFIRMHENKPVLQPCPYSQEHIKHLDEIFNGIKHFVEDLVAMLPFDIGEINLDKKFAYHNLQAFYSYAKKGNISKQLAASLYNEDFLTNVEHKQNFKSKE